MELSVRRAAAVMLTWLTAAATEVGEGGREEGGVECEEWVGEVAGEVEGEEEVSPFCRARRK